MSVAVGLLALIDLCHQTETFSIPSTFPDLSEEVPPMKLDRIFARRLLLLAAVSSLPSLAPGAEDKAYTDSNTRSP